MAHKLTLWRKLNGIKSINQIFSKNSNDFRLSDKILTKGFIISRVYLFYSRMVVGRMGGAHTTTLFYSAKLFSLLKNNNIYRVSNKMYWSSKLNFEVVNALMSEILVFLVILNLYISFDTLLVCFHGLMNTRKQLIFQAI